MPVVCIHTECLVMLSEIERTPDSLEVKHIEIIIIFQVVNKFDADVIF